MSTSRRACGSAACPCTTPSVSMMALSNFASLAAMTGSVWRVPKMPRWIVYDQKSTKHLEDLRGYWGTTDFWETSISFCHPPIFCCFKFLVQLPRWSWHWSKYWMPLQDWMVQGPFLKPQVCCQRLHFLRGNSARCSAITPKSSGVSSCSFLE